MSVVHTAGLFRARPDVATLETLARRLAGSGPLQYHGFEPHGASLVILGAATRVVLHTWPEHALVTIDVYATTPVDLASLAAEFGWERLTEAAKEAPR